MYIQTNFKSWKSWLTETNFEFLKENFSKTIWYIGLKFSEITEIV